MLIICAVCGKCANFPQETHFRDYVSLSFNLKNCKDKSSHDAYILAMRDLRANFASVCREKLQLLQRTVRIEVRKLVNLYYPAFTATTLERKRKKEKYCRGSA